MRHLILICRQSLQPKSWALNHQLDDDSGETRTTQTTTTTEQRPAIENGVNRAAALGDGAKPNPEAGAQPERPAGEAAWLQYARALGNNALPSPDGPKRYVGMTKNVDGSKTFLGLPITILNTDWQTGTLTFRQPGASEPGFVDAETFFKSYAIPPELQPSAPAEVGDKLTEGTETSATPPKPEAPTKVEEKPIDQAEAIKIFGISAEESKDLAVIKLKYKQLARQFHPDVIQAQIKAESGHTPADFTSEEKAEFDAAQAPYRRINEAYKVLTTALEAAVSSDEQPTPQAETAEQPAATQTPDDEEMVEARQPLAE